MNSDLSSPYVDINGASLGMGRSEAWTYTMRREMQVIVPSLYLGPYASSPLVRRTSASSRGLGSPTWSVSERRLSYLDDFEDTVESVEISVSLTSKAKRNTMKRGAVTSEEVRARGEAEGAKVSPEIEDQIEILTGDQLAERDTRQGYLHMISELL